MNSRYTVGILVASDTCAAGFATDQSGLNLKDLIDSHKENAYKTIDYCIVKDDIAAIKEKLIEWSDDLKLDLILTTGGTGFSPRDITPEATKEVISKELPSLTNAILIESLKITKFAMLSRAVCGIRNKTLILNLPGSKKASQESINIVFPVLKHALDLIKDSKLEINMEHLRIQNQNGTHANIQETSSTHICSHSKSRVTSEDISSKPRSSEYPMISVDDALSIILTKSNLADTEEIFYLDTIGRVSATNVYAQDPLPPFPASVKDGFAVKLFEKQKTNSNDIPFVFEVIGSSHAGDDINIDLKEGQCVKINTGAPVPFKADAVIQIEDTISLEKNSKGEDTKIQIVGSGPCGGGGNKTEVKIEIGQDIRSVGFDIKAGELVMNERTLINAAQIGVCATVGALKLKVFKLPTVSLISTGNELRKPEEADLKSGQIRDANKSLLYAALKSFGLNDIYDAGICKDDPDSVLEIFKKAMEKSDVIISTGGVSMGDKDLVKDVLLKDLKCEIHFARLNMKPGKPTTFATTIYQGKRKLFFCLPGNPVSAIVTFNLVVLPCLKQIMGYTNPLHTEIKVKSEFDVNQLDPRPEYHRVFIEWPVNGSDSYYPSAFSTGNQHSSRLLSMNRANALVKLPGKNSSKANIKKGEILSALIIDKI